MVIPMRSTHPVRLVVDGVFFQIGRSGIARVWQKIFEHWIRTGFSEQVVVLDRAGTLPRIPGLVTMDIPAFHYGREQQERQMLQQACDAAQASVFMSTYYTSPSCTPSLMMVHDMIPEVLGWDLNEPMWLQKQEALRYASAYVTVSHNTANDLRRHLVTNLGCHRSAIQVARAGCDFRPAQPAHIEDLRARLGLSRPYFMLSGTRTDYKNAALFFEAFGALCDERAQLSILCTGGGDIDPAFQRLAGPATVHQGILDDYDMQAAYSGSLALVYPSRYEGFGLPVLEAMACGAPVICSNAASLPEVGGPAPLYIDLGLPPVDQVAQLAQKLRDVQQDSVRTTRIAKGLIQAAGFSWTEMAEQLMRQVQQLHDELHPQEHITQTARLSKVGTVPLWLPHSHDIEGARRAHPLFSRLWGHLANALPARAAVWDLEAGHGEMLTLMAEERADLQLYCHDASPLASQYLDINMNRLASHLRHSPVKLSPQQGLEPALVINGDRLPQADQPSVLRLAAESEALPATVGLSWIEALRPDVVLLEYRGPERGADRRQLLDALGERGHQHHWVFDNYGNLMLETSSTQAIQALCDYLDRQCQGQASRSIFHLEVLSCRDTALAWCQQAVHAHLNTNASAPLPETATERKAA